MVNRHPNKRIRTLDYGKMGKRFVILRNPQIEGSVEVVVGSLLPVAGLLERDLHLVVRDLHSVLLEQLEYALPDLSGVGSAAVEIVDICSEPDLYAGVQEVGEPGGRRGPPLVGDDVRVLVGGLDHELLREGGVLLREWQ